MLLMTSQITTPHISNTAICLLVILVNAHTTKTQTYNNDQTGEPQQACSFINKQTSKQANKQTSKNKQKQAKTSKNKQTSKQANKQTSKQANLHKQYDCACQFSPRRMGA